MRTGAYALSLLAVPINVQALAALASGPKSLVELRRAAGSPPPTTLRGHLRKLTEIGVVDRRRQEGWQPSVEYELTPSGRELAAVAATLNAWLAEAPDGPVELGSTAARAAVKALAEGWSTGMIRALASKPLTLTELDRLIAEVTYPSLERRLEAMRMTGQIEPTPSKTRGTPYIVTDWLRKSIAPIIAAVHWEQMQRPSESAAITRIDVEAAFMMTVPLLSLDSSVTGTARLAVEMITEDGPKLAGVMVPVDGGRIESATTRLNGDGEASVVGAATTWIRAVTEPEPELLRIDGDRRLGVALVEGIHDVLFGGAARTG